MESERQQRVRDRAHEIWIETGRPEGMADHHWKQAEHEEHTRGAKSADEGDKIAKAKLAKSAAKSIPKIATKPAAAAKPGGKSPGTKPAPKAAAMASAKAGKATKRSSAPEAS